MLKLNLKLTLSFSIVVLLQINYISGATYSKNNFLRSFDIKDPRIINGTEANLNSTKHQVSIRKRLQDSYFFGTGHICGGSLISENVVLCAAHCFANYNIPDTNVTFLPDKHFIVVMGNLDRYEYNNNTLVFDIVNIVKHAEIFNLETYANDIVLIILNGTVPSNHPTIKPIILNEGPLKNNTICQATGWGKTENGYNPDLLRTVDLPIIDSDDCREKTVYGDAIIAGTMCAGYLEGERDACQGDSGGPLVCRGLQAGIISWGDGCAKALHPGVFTEVSYFKKWILKEAAYHNGTLPKFAGNSAVNRNDDSGDDGTDDGAGNGTDGGSRNGVTSLSCLIFLLSLMLVYNFIFSHMK